MVWPFDKKPKQPQQPSIREQVREESLGEMRVRESITPEMVKDGSDYDFQAIDDEKILYLFDPASPMYEPLLAPLLPLASRLCFLSDCDTQDARVYKLKVSTLIEQLRNYTRGNPRLYFLLDSMEAYLHMRINDSIGGFKIKTLSTRRKEFEYKEVQQKRKGLFG